MMPGVEDMRGEYICGVDSITTDIGMNGQTPVSAEHVEGTSGVVFLTGGAEHSASITSTVRIIRVERNAKGSADWFWSDMELSPGDISGHLSVLVVCWLPAFKINHGTLGDMLACTMRFWIVLDIPGVLL
jgi:hypothetical protein